MTAETPTVRPRRCRRPRLRLRLRLRPRPGSRLRPRPHPGVGPRPRQGRPPAPLAAGLLLALAALLPAAASAQPFGAYIAFSGTGSSTAGNGYLEVPDGPALNPPAAITLEGWVLLSTPFTSPPGGGCRSLIGKDYTHAYWLGVCGSTVRAYFRGTGSFHDAGTVPARQWTHVAVTYDGTAQKHYINGELIRSFAVSGPPAGSSAPLWIGGDVSWVYSPDGAVTELRLWNVARTIDQIRATINVPLTSADAPPGLVAAWSLGANGNDALGAHDGTLVGTFTPLAPPAVLNCGGSTASALCLQSSFFITVAWRTPDGTTGAGTVVPVAGTGSGIFWFFASTNWEVMVKVIDGCVLDGAFWVFSAATTNVFYRMEVADVRSGTTKIYFNYPGPPAPAVTDTAAFPGSCG
jgi:Concanavalin A-like lectin/glucanases superfamily